MITVTPKAIDAVKSFLAEQGGSKSIRVHLRSTGCCDASLGLMLDDAGADDLTFDIPGITFVISAELGKLTGDVTVDYVTEKERTGFVLTPARPISEWDGFGVCTINA